MDITEAHAYVYQVHFLPLLLFSFDKLRRSPRKLLWRALLGTSRSAAFIATFVAAVWSGVCLGRTRIGSRIYPVQQFCECRLQDPSGRDQAELMRISRAFIREPRGRWRRYAAGVLHVWLRESERDTSVLSGFSH